MSNNEQALLIVENSCFHVLIIYYRKWKNLEVRITWTTWKKFHAYTCKLVYGGELSEEIPRSIFIIICLSCDFFI